MSAERVKELSSSKALPTKKMTRRSSIISAKLSSLKEKGMTSSLGETETKLFVLDTNVLMHDPMCIYRFEKHDLFIPMMILEEIDNNKKGPGEINRNSREFMRTIDGLVEKFREPLQQGIPLSTPSNKLATGRLFIQSEAINVTSKHLLNLPTAKADNQIIGILHYLTATLSRRTVVLVSKDINMRIKARALGLHAEDYFNDKVLEDTDFLYTGTLDLDLKEWNRIVTPDRIHWDGNKMTYHFKDPSRKYSKNQFVHVPGGGEKGRDLNAIITRYAIDGSGEMVTIKDYIHQKNSIWGINARNKEQNYALHLLMDPDIDFVTLLGQAGTGKTLLTLVAGLAQVLEDKIYNEIIFTRVTVPVGEDIGFLPGTEEEKMTPWMGALEDNLDVLNKTSEEGGEWGRAVTRDLIRSRIKIKSLNFMRGRTFINKFLVIDEAQNLTSKQMKTLVTRAGPGTKVVCLGNIAQIDTPYLTEGSSGLTYVVERFKGWDHSGHITLQRGERSRLADHAAEVL